MVTESDLQKGMKLYREQLVTVEDLEAFKIDLLKAIEELLKPSTWGTKEWLKSSAV